MENTASSLRCVATNLAYPSHRIDTIASKHARDTDEACAHRMVGMDAVFDAGERVGPEV